MIIMFEKKKEKEKKKKRETATQQLSAMIIDLLIAH